MTVETQDEDVSEWPREIWAREHDQFDAMGIHVFSEHATVPRYEGDTERDGEHHRYVDGDIYDSAENYFRQMLENLRAYSIALQAEVEAFKAGVRKVLPLMEAASREEVTDVADWDEAEDMLRSALNETPDTVGDEVEK